MIGKNEVISEFDKLRMPYNINTLTMIASEFFYFQKKDEIIQKC
jgi:histidinol-phosphate/aromatic aminotransferase/cobyric acid decarboxylase-like protein